MAIAYQHALVVGGTGMLRKVVVWLSGNGYAVSVIARDRQKLEVLTDLAPGRLHAVPVNYADDAALTDELIQSIRRFGPLSLAVLWIRPGAPNALNTIATIADQEGGEGSDRRCRLFRILGSSAADPALKRSDKGGRYRAMEGLRYREITLGFRVHRDTARWNTNDEIAAGVIHAIRHDIEDHVIGVVRPWEMRPPSR